MNGWADGTTRGRVGPTACGAGALLLSSLALTPLFTDLSWLPVLVAVVALVALTGVGLRSVHAPLSVVLLAQLAVLAVLVTVLFTSSGVLGVLPGPAALAEVRQLLDGAGTQVQDESVPVQVSTELELLLVLLVGAAAIVVDGLVAGLRAPAGAGLVLLTLVAVPASLLDELLPWWSFVLGAAALVLLLVADGAQRVPRAGPAAGSAGLRAPAVLGVVGVAVVAGLLAGSAAVGVGTQGRLSGTGGGVAINPFTQLRGQLDQPDRVPLFTVAGLDDPTYLRALSLDTYVADQGWVLDGAQDDEGVDGPLADEPTTGRRVDITVSPQRYDDRWLPVPGTPQQVAGTNDSLAGYSYDTTLDTLHTARARSLPGYRVQSVVPTASAATLRSQGSPTAGQQGAVDQRFYGTGGIDPRVAELAEQVAGAQPTALDAAVTLSTWFRDPANGFRYDLSTADTGTGGDALVDFLTVGRTGFCEQFASAMAAMLRTLGIPTRVAVGFTAGTGDVARRQVTTSDAHAWVEVYFAGTGWVVFDPTPLGDGRGVVPSYVSEAEQSPASAAPSAAEPAAPTAAPAAPSASAPVPQDPQQDLAGAEQGATSTPSVWPRRLGLGALVAAGVLSVLGAPATVRAARRRRRWADGTPEAVWDELLDCAADRGADPRPQETPRQSARRMVTEHGLDTAGSGAVHEVVDAVEQSWYGAAATGGGVRTAQRPVVERGRAAVAALGRTSPLRGRARLLPRSLRRRVGASALKQE